MGYSETGKYLISGHESGKIKIWETKTGVIHKEMQEKSLGAIYKVIFTKNDKDIVAYHNSK